MQKYLPLLNSVYSSSISESSINITLKDKLNTLIASKFTRTSKNIPAESKITNFNYPLMENPLSRDGNDYREE